jgi:hypothetical protein
LISFALVPFKHHGNAGAVHEDDLPVARPFFEESRSPTKLFKSGSSLLETRMNPAVPLELSKVFLSELT